MASGDVKASGEVAAKLGGLASDATVPCSPALAAESFFVPKVGAKSRQGLTRQWRLVG